MAARAGHTEVAKYLLQNKAKVNAKAKVCPGGGKQFQLHAEKPTRIRGLATELVAQ